jgi:hypothetical protein
MGLCLAYQLADRGRRRVPVVQQNPVAIRKEALQYSQPPTSHREPRQRGTGSPFHAPSTVTTSAYMAYRARGAYLQDGLFTVHNSDFRKDQNSGRRIVSARLLGRGAARTLNGVLMSAAGRPGAYATRKAISSSAASIAAVYHGQ